MNTNEPHLSCCLILWKLVGTLHTTAEPPANFLQIPKFILLDS